MKLSVEFSGVIFDLDGTLLDSLEDIANATNETIASMGGAIHPVEAYKTMVGDGVVTLFERAFPEAMRDSQSMAECFEIYHAAYERNWNNRSKPYDGILCMLENLQNAGLKLAVLSNKPDPFTQKCVAHFFPSANLDIVLGHSDRFPCKPDPSSAIWIGGEMNIDANRMAYVGDTNTDMKTAIDAGYRAIGVTWGFRPESELRECGAHEVAAAVIELERILLR